jgi:DNA-binding MarR family transcriptional regulator
MKKATHARAGSKSPLVDAGLCNNAALRKATRRVSQLYDSVLAPSGLRSTQMSILVHIDRAGTPSMSELAVALVMDRSALTHNLKPLERDGFVGLVPSKSDGRSRLATLTAVGRVKLGECHVLWRRAQKNFEVALGTNAAAQLRTALGQIASEDFANRFSRLRSTREERRASDRHI